MKKLVVGIIVFLLTSTAVMAQSANDLYTSAINYGSSYRSAYSEYVQAKNQHQQYATGATRNVAIEKTNKVLVARNDWFIYYLLFLRQSLADATNIANYPNTVTYLDLEDQLRSLSNMSDLGSGTNFSEINTHSLGWEKNLEQLDRLVSASQLQVASAGLANFQNQLGGFLEAYEQNHATPSATAQTTLNLIKDKLNTSITKRQGIDKQLSSYKGSHWSYSTLAKDLSESRLLLLDSAKLLEELSRQP